jgi:hypothetical protein
MNIENSITDASALRIAQMIGADYLIIATINSVGKENRKFKGKGTIYKTDTEVTIYTLRISIKVTEGNEGGTVYGDIVSASKKIPKLTNLEIESDDTINELLDQGSLKIAQNISEKISKIRNAKVDTRPTVAFTVGSNIEGAILELDGAVLGSLPGQFQSPPGLHQVRVSKEFFKTWEKTVNIFENQTINLVLEFTNEGHEKFKDIETFKIEIARQKQNLELDKKTAETRLEIGKEQSKISGEIAKEQSEADAYSKKKIAEGEKVKREKSYVRDDGLGDLLKMLIR